MIASHEIINIKYEIWKCVLKKFFYINNILKNRINGKPKKIKLQKCNFKQIFSTN